jgi:hypothetical protein
MGRYVIGLVTVVLFSLLTVIKPSAIYIADGLTVTGADGPFGGK